MVLKLFPIAFLMHNFLHYFMMFSSLSNSFISLLFLSYTRHFLRWEPITPAVSVAVFSTGERVFAEERFLLMCGTSK